MTFRDSPAFKYGWLPIRFIAGLIGYAAGAVVWAAAYVQWFDPRYARNATRGIFG